MGYLPGILIGKLAGNGNRTRIYISFLTATGYSFNHSPDSQGCWMSSYQATGHDACKVRVTSYLLWDDDHNGSADVGSTIQSFSKNGFHHPWRSTAWEIHPVIKLETHWFYGRGRGVGWRGRGVGVHLPVHGVAVGVGVGCGGIGALIQVITSLFTCSQ